MLGARASRGGTPHACPQALERELSELEKTAVSKWKQKGEDAALGRLEPASGLAHVTCARYLRSEKSTEPAKKEDHRHHLALQGAQQVGACLW